MMSLNDMWSDLRTHYAARHEPEHIVALAQLWWRTVLVATFAFMVWTLIWGVWSFMSVVTQVSTQTSASAPPPSLDRKQLEATLTAYESRQREFDALKTSPPAFADPSK